MPGVADAERRTQLKQEQRARKTDMEELLRMVKEGRIHEADERQLELLKLALELNTVVGNKEERPADNTEVINAVRAAVTEILTNLPKGLGGISSSGQADPSRPGMKHSSLTDIEHQKFDLDISHLDTLSQSHDGSDESSDKLEKLKRLKGSK